MYHRSICSNFKSISASGATFQMPLPTAQTKPTYFVRLQFALLRDTLTRLVMIAFAPRSSAIALTLLFSVQFCHGPACQAKIPSD